MGRFLAVVMLGSVAVAQVSFAGTKPEQNANAPSAANLETTPGGLSALPALPKGQSTVIGGVIRNVDPVRDQLTLQVFGGKPMKILFDERTQVYRDGTKVPLSALRPKDHASVETTLDGTDIFALRVHMLSQSPQGELQGQVVSYDPGTGALTVRDALSGAPMNLRVPAGTPVVRLGQAAKSAPSTASSASADSSSLTGGALVSVKFTSDNKGGGIASQIAILATPGSTFVFTGNVTFLDLHSNVLVLVDPRDGKSYRIYFDPSRVPVGPKLHEGAHVKVTTSFDGSRYVASAITVH